MRRRALLAVLGSALSAGCSGVFGRDPPATDTVTPAPVPPSPSATPTPTPTERDGCEGTEGPYRQDDIPIFDLRPAPERYEDLGCPTFEWADRVVCYHRADLPAEPLVLLGPRSPSRVDSTDGAVAEFAFVNRADRPVSVEPHNWAVLGRPQDDGDWRVLRSGGTTCLRTVHPEQVYWWRLGVNAAPDPAHAVNVSAVETTLDLGTYLFAIRVAPTEDTVRVCAAPFTVGALVGDPDPVTPVRDE
jgi:hypothetical protein